MCGKILTFFRPYIPHNLPRDQFGRGMGQFWQDNFSNSQLLGTLLSGRQCPQVQFQQSKILLSFYFEYYANILLLSLTILLKRSKEYNLPQSQEKQIKCYNSLAVLIQVIILKRFQTLFITWSDQVDRALKSPKVTIVKARACLE